MSEPQKVESKPAILQDPLAECVQSVFKFLGVHADIIGLMAEIPRKPGLMRPDDIYPIAEKLRLDAKIRKYSEKDVMTRNMPVILLMKGDEPPRVCMPMKTHGGKIYKPGDGLTKETFKDLKDVYSGQAIIVRPHKSESALDTDHMKHGHAIDWFWKPIMQYWPNYLEVMLCTLFINMFVIALPMFTMTVYDTVVPNFATETLMVLASGIAIALIFDFVLKTMRAYILERLAARLGTQFDFDLMERLMLVNSQENQLSIGERANLFRELQGIRDFYAARLAPTVVDLPFFLLFIVVVDMLSPALALIPISMAVLIMAVNLGAQVVISRVTKRYFSTMQKKSSVMVETLTGIGAFKVYNAMGSRLFNWNLSAANAADAAQFNQFVLAVTQNISVMLMQFVHIGVVFFGVYEINEGNLTIGGLIACTILSSRSMAPVLALASVLGKYKQSRDVLMTIDRLFKLPHEGVSISSNAPKGPFKGTYEFRDVTYTYPGQSRPALSKVNLTIQAGEKVGLIGRSGAGKTTLSRLMTGHMGPNDGTVFLDGVTLGNIPPTELRREIGIVPQNPFFVTGTIKDNVILGCEDMPEAIFEQAVEYSGLNLVVQQTGHGLDMQVGEGGDRLSGGQKQAIALARAFMRNPSILIFDEPTTGMDHALEHKVKVTLQEFLVDKTFIMVTHRTSLLSLVDRLILLDSGRVLADGPRDEMMKKLSGQV